ncbi:MAG: VOC family protein [Paracoccaceae bacterium]
MAFTPFLYFDGTAEAAMTFYARLFGATDLEVMRFSDAPEGSDMGGSDRVMYSQLTINGHTLGAWDFPPGMTAVPQASVSVGHEVADFAEGERIYNALSEGGEQTMPFGATFF